MPRSRRGLATVAFGLALVTTSCGGGGGAQGGGSGEPAGQERNVPGPLVTQGVADYEAYVAGQVDEMATLTRTFTDAVRAGDLAAAQAAYAPSREPWERIEPVAGLVEDIDVAVDARVDDFANEDDPEFTGWHRLEYLLFAQQTTEGAAPFADQLDADVARLQRELPSLEVPPTAVAIGASELIEEVSLGKITGEEDRYSKTDLWDFAANVEGSRAVIDALRPALQQADPELLAEIDSGFETLNTSLQPLQRGDGWVLYCQQDDPYPSPRCPGVTVDQAAVNGLKADLAALSEDLALVAGALGLR